MEQLSIIGNLTRDPEIKSTTSGVSVCEFTVAVTRKGGNEKTTNFYRVSAWRGLGDTCHRYLAKGRAVYVSGELTVRQYQSKDGQTKVSLEVKAEKVEFVSSHRDEENGQYVRRGDVATAPEPASTQSGMTPVNTDELPF